MRAGRADASFRMAAVRTSDMPGRRRPAGCEEKEGVRLRCPGWERNGAAGGLRCEGMFRTGCERTGLGCFGMVVPCRRTLEVGGRLPVASSRSLAADCRLPGARCRMSGVGGGRRTGRMPGDAGRAMMRRAGAVGGVTKRCFRRTVASADAACGARSARADSGPPRREAAARTTPRSRNFR